MSKITKALEKAARERLQRQEEQPTVAPKATEIRVVASGLASTRALDTLTIDPHLVAASDPQSPIAEQYRILRTNLQSLRKLSDLKTLLVTSSIRGEGKSVTAINLALTLAQQRHLKVLLMDADLRRGQLHKWLGFEAGRGLSTALTNGLELDDLIVTLQDTGLSILPSGPAPANPAELLDSGAMKRLLDRLRTQYDVIVIDSPPVLPVADPGILGRLVDGVLFVIRSGSTQQRTVQQAYELLKQSKARMLGSVLTHVEHYIPGYYKYYHYYRDDEKAGNGNGNGHGRRSKTVTPPPERSTESPEDTTS